MPIISGSRYANSTVVNLPSDTGPRQTIVSGGQDDFTITFVSHQIAGWERVDTLAYTYHNNDQLWWRIADANPEIMDWDNLTPGQIIRIPNA